MNLVNEHIAESVNVESARVARNIAAGSDFPHTVYADALCADTVYADIERVRQHSEKAMKLAKSMRKTRQKAKTGQVICHHLRMMLAEELPPVSGRRLRHLQLTDRQFPAANLAISSSAANSPSAGSDGNHSESAEQIPLI